MPPILQGLARRLTGLAESAPVAATQEQTRRKLTAVERIVARFAGRDEG